MAERVKKGQKTSFSEKAKKAKSDVSEWNKKIREAREIGYLSGWNDRDKMPETRGARIALQSGYDEGVRNHSRLKKYAKESPEERKKRKKNNRP